MAISTTELDWLTRYVGDVIGWVNEDDILIAQMGDELAKLRSVHKRLKLEQEVRMESWYDRRLLTEGETDHG